MGQYTNLYQTPWIRLSHGSKGNMTQYTTSTEYSQNDGEKSWANNGEIATVNDVNQAVADLVNGAPETLNTLGELADALKNNADIVDVLNSAIADKASKKELENVGSTIPTNTETLTFTIEENGTTKTVTMEVFVRSVT